MKKYLYIIFALFLCLPAFAQDVNVGTPYRKVLEISDTTGSWSASANNIYVWEFRCRDSGKVQIKVPDSAAYFNVYVGQNDIVRLAIDSIKLDSTTARGINVFGFKRKYR